jgi:hypothetical protein
MLHALLGPGLSETLSTIPGSWRGINSSLFTKEKREAQRIPVTYSSSQNENMGVLGCQPVLLTAYNPLIPLKHKPYSKKCLTRTGPRGLDTPSPKEERRQFGDDSRQDS